MELTEYDDNTGRTNPVDYQKTTRLEQFGEWHTSQTIPVLKEYEFYGVFPTNVSEIEVSYDSTDIIEEFTVTLQVQWWDALRNYRYCQLDTEVHNLI